MQPTPRQQGVGKEALGNPEHKHDKGAARPRFGGGTQRQGMGSTHGALGGRAHRVGA